MKMTGIRFKAMVGVATAACLTTTAACSDNAASVSSDSGGAKSVTIGLVEGWDEGEAATELWKQILEQKGYTVTVKALEVAPVYAGVASGQIDLYMDAWLPTTHESYWKKLGDEMEVVGKWYYPADLQLAVPTYVKDVNSLSDLKGKESEFGGEIIGIESGSGLNTLTQQNVIPQYGLQSYDFVQSSTAAMLSSLDSAIKDHKPVLVTLWRPHWAYTKYDIKALDDPKNAYGDPDSAEIVATKGWSDEQPDLSKWMGKFKLTSEQLGSLELLMQQKGNEAGVQQWMKENQDLVNSWTK